MAKIAVIAHNVSVPLYKHRSKEFSERMYFMAKWFDEVHILSKEGRISDKDGVAYNDENVPNLAIRRIHSGLILSSLDILRVIRDMRVDVLFADGLGHGVSCILCKKKHRIPLVTFVQGFEADLKAIALKLRFGINPSPGSLSKVFAMYDLLAMRSSDRVLCVSQGLVKYAYSLLPKKDHEKVKFIPHSLQYVGNISKEAMMWAEDIMSSFANPTRQFPIIMVVGVGPAKGTGIALRAHKYIVEKNPDAVMILIGKIIDPGYVRIRKELGIERNTIFLWNLPRDRLLALLSRATVFLLPSFSEGFSWAVAEAMALGVPAVVYANKAMRTAASIGAIADVKTTDPKDYARECMSLIMDEERRRSLVEKAKKYIEPYVNFSEQERFKLICKSIDDVLACA